MVAYVLNIILTVIAVITGIISLIFFFIGYADDKDMYVPAIVWLMFCIGSVALSYLLVAFG